MDWKKNFIIRPFWFTWITFVLLLLWLPIGFAIPESWGWENGPVENFQFVFLAFGIYASWRASRTYKDDKLLHAWWLWSIGAWILIIGRELSWGRSFFPSTPPGVAPEFLSKEEIWFGPYVHPCVFLVLVVLLAGLVWNFSWEKLKATVRIPIWDAISFFVCFLCFSLFEQDVIDVPDEYNMRMEEVGETIAYWNLACIVFLNSFKMPKMKEDGKSIEGKTETKNTLE